MSYPTSLCGAPRRGRIPARLGATLLALLLAAGLPACDALDPEELLGADNKNRPGVGPATTLKPVTITPDEELINAIGHTRQLQVTVLNPGGQPRQNPAVTWRSLNPGVATVDNKGRVTAVAAGLALIAATSGGNADTAHVEVQQVVADLTVTPASATLALGATLQLAAAASDSNQVKIRNPTLSWSSSHPEIAKVDASGRVTRLVEGTVTIMAMAVADNVSATSSISDEKTPPPPPPPPPPPAAGWDRVLADTIVRGPVVVPDGQRWLIGRNVQIAGNLRTVNGTIAMRPGSSLKFLGADPAKYVGGGMHYTDAFANDIGLWVGGHGARGVLDIQCTPKTSWNRTGVDPTWGRDDEYWIAPTARGDFMPKRWYPGQAIPRIDSRVPAAEVANVTRDCVIEGPGHIHIHSSSPQRIEYVQLRTMGIIIPGISDSGRYGIHFHMMGDGGRGTIVRGVAAIGSRGRVFVAHASHGVTLTDNVAVNSWGEVFWWDMRGGAGTPEHRTGVGAEDRSNDILVDRLAVLGVHAPRAVTGSTSRASGIVMAGGDNLEIRNSVVAGAWGSKSSNGFNWPSAADNHGHAIWKFDTGNVSHNNQGAGIRFWFNNRAPHMTRNFITYRNAVGGVENGAYINAQRFADALILDGIFQHSSSKEQELDGGPAGFYRVRVENESGPALRTGRFNLISERASEEARRVTFEDCTLQGTPKVLIDDAKQKNPAWLLFRRCGLRPEDVVFGDLSVPGLQGSSIVIDNGPGQRWEITVQNSKRVVRELR